MRSPSHRVHTPNDRKTTFLSRLTNSVPLLVSVILHVVLITVVGYFVVTETIIGRKKAFEQVAPPENTAKKQLDHRIQVARKAGGSSPSPVSAQRILSTAENALQLPALTELPASGASALGSAGFGAGAGVTGGGTGFNTSLSGGGGLGRGFMSMSFLGMTDVRARKIVFVIDIGPALLDIRKGGFRAFSIIREEIARLVASMPLAAEFNVMLFIPERITPRVEAFSKELIPATYENKQAFLAWLAPINTDMNKLGFGSVSKSVRWRPRPIKLGDIGENYKSPQWSHTIRAALELEPDTVFLITGSGGNGIRSDGVYTDAELAAQRQRNLDKAEYYRKNNIDLKAVAAARGAAFGKAVAALNAANKKLVAAGKDPFILIDSRRLLDADFQAALRKAGVNIVVDTTGWTDPKTKALIWDSPPAPPDTKKDDDDDGKNPRRWVGAPVRDLLTYISRVQTALSPKQKANLNLFLFVGPNERPHNIMDDFTKVARSNGGRFQLLDTKRLIEIQRQNEEKEKKDAEK